MHVCLTDCAIVNFAQGAMKSCCFPKIPVKGGELTCKGTIHPLRWLCISTYVMERQKCKKKKKKCQNTDVHIFVHSHGVICSYFYRDMNANFFITPSIFYL